VEEAAGAIAAAAAAEAGLIYLGRTYGSPDEERKKWLPGDDIIAEAVVQTDHAITIERAALCCLALVGPDGLGPRCLDPERALVLRSNSHLPMSWRDHATLDWTWTFVLTPVDGGRRTRYHFRWVTAPWWWTLIGRLGVVPADFVMARDHLKGVKLRAEKLALAA
jgi:hypothetical protein